MPPIFWTQKQDIGPGGRTSVSLTFDSARQRVLLFGGDPGGSPLADTWAWENGLWTQVADTGPSPRRGASVVDEAAQQRVLLFGGGTGMDVLGDTWVCATGDWTQVADTGPPRASTTGWRTTRSANGSCCLAGRQPASSATPGSGMASSGRRFRTSGRPRQPVTRSRSTR